MPTAKFIAPDGVEQVVNVDLGQSLMQAAVDNSVYGILAECGGFCTCATCHCIVDDMWIAKTQAPDEFEVEMLELALGRKSTSRLTCQLEMTPELDGIVLWVPEAQC